MMNPSGMDAETNSELRFWLNITRRLPRVRGSGRLCGVIKRVYNRKKRSDALVDVLGFEMLLDPADSMEHQFLLCPHLYDRHEIGYLRAHLKPGDVFLDAGANVGFYSLIASGLVGKTGKVLSVEADPFNAARLAANVKLSDAANVRVANVGLSDKAETLRLGLNTTGNRGGNSFLSESPDGVTVPCNTLTEVLLSHGIDRVDGAKMDIEGFELKVLQRFFADGKKNLWPKFLIIEDNPFLAKQTSGKTLELLKQNGYELTQISELNFFAVRK